MPSLENWGGVYYTKDSIGLTSSQGVTGVVEEVEGGVIHHQMVCDISGVKGENE